MADEMDHDRDARALIASALKRSGMSARRAAQDMPITDTRLRHIINGYQPAGRGQRIKVIAPTDTLAEIALALGITPEAMDRTERKDAAAAMRARLADNDLIPGNRAMSRILAEHDEIREWAEDGIEIYMPPDSLLRLFDNEQLLAEVQRRMERGDGISRDHDDPPPYIGPPTDVSEDSDTPGLAPAAETGDIEESGEF
jgi:hypothetical protein